MSTENSYFATSWASPTTVSADVPGQSLGLLDWLARSQGGWPGPQAAADLPVSQALRTERVRSGPQGVVIPWFLPYFDEQQTLYETASMRLAYRRMMSDPNVKAALLGKILAVAALDLKVIPHDKKDRQAQEDAEFVRWNLEEGLEGGVPGLIWSVLSGALIDGYSVSEKVWAMEQRGEHRGKYYLRSVKPKDTGRDVVLETDQWRNVVSVKGLRYNPGVEFSPADFIIYRHLPLWDTATGTSDLRAVYSRWWMLDTVLKLRAVAAEKRALPVIVGHYTNASDRTPLEEALALVRSQNWLAVPETVRLEALSIAGGAESTFSEFAKDCKHDIFLGIAGAMLQSLEGSVPGGRGSSAEHRDTADLFVWHLSKAIETLLNDHHRGIVRDIVDLNRAVNKYPKAVLASVSVSDQLASLEVSEKLYLMGVKQNLDEIYELAARQPPDPDDPTTSLGGKVDQDAQLAASTLMVKTSDGRPNMASPGVAGAMDQRVHDHVQAGEGHTLSQGLPDEGQSPIPGVQMDEEQKVHKFSSTQFDLTGPLASRILQMAAAIPDEDLAEDGREDKPHITVKFGLHTDDPAEVAAIVSGFGPVSVRLGRVSVFPAKEGSDFDVVKVEVESGELRRLNELISGSLECTDAHPTYNPHATLAYVKAGLGKKHAGKYLGDETTFDTLVFSDKKRNKTKIPLSPPPPDTEMAEPGERDFAKAQTSSQAAAYQQQADVESGGDNAKVAEEPEPQQDNYPAEPPPRPQGKPMRGSQAIMPKDLHGLVEAVRQEGYYRGASGDVTPAHALADWYEDSGDIDQANNIRSVIERATSAGSAPGWEPEIMSIGVNEAERLINELLQPTDYTAFITTPGGALRREVKAGRKIELDQEDPEDERLGHYLSLYNIPFAWKPREQFDEQQDPHSGIRGNRGTGGRAGASPGNLPAGRTVRVPRQEARGRVQDGENSSGRSRDRKEGSDGRDLVVASQMAEPTSSGVVVDAAGREQTFLGGKHVSTPPLQTKPDAEVGIFTKRVPGKKPKKITGKSFDEEEQVTPIEQPVAPVVEPPASPRLAVYSCPLCEGGLALDGDPLRGILYREQCKCQDCGGTFDRMLGELITREGPELRPLPGLIPTEQQP